MQALVTFLVEYALIIASGLMLLWAVLVMSKRAITKRLWFRLFPFVFVLIVLAKTVYHPLVITSPKSGVIIHPGESIQVTVKMYPAFLSTLFPSVGVDIPRCPSCKDTPEGVLVYGALTGSPYHFTIEFPKTLPSGVLVTSATAGISGQQRPIMRSAFIKFIVKTK